MEQEDASEAKMNSSISEKEKSRQKRPKVSLSMANLGKKVQTFLGTSLLTSVLPVCTVPIQYHGDIESAHLVQYMVLSQRRRRHVCKEYDNLMKDLICEKMELMRSNFKTTFHLCESTCLACPKCH